MIAEPKPWKTYILPDPAAVESRSHSHSLPLCYAQCMRSGKRSADSLVREFQRFSAVLRADKLSALLHELGLEEWRSSCSCSGPMGEQMV